MPVPVFDFFAISLPVGALAIAGLLSLAVGLTLITDRLKIPLTVLLVLVGFTAGEVADWRGIDIELGGKLFEEIVVFVFLPTLIYASAREISARVFVRNLVPILTLAIPAYLVSALFVGGGLHYVLGTDWAVSLLFGALISATDPVAVVAVFRKLGVPRRLLTLLEGESLLNDGMAIVLFEILLVAALGSSVSVAGGVIDFLKVFFGGAALGAGMGLMVALLIPRLNPFAAAALSLALAYGGFALADEVLGFSGVLATMTAGLVVGAATPAVASPELRTLWDGLWQSLSFVANALLFLIIGLAIDVSFITEHVSSILIAIACVLVARPLAVLPLEPLTTRLAGIPPLGARNEFVLVWGGLRGGVALALALSIPLALAEREMLIAMTAGVVIATLLLNATSIRYLITRFGIDRPTRSERFLAAAARVRGARAARRRIADLKFESQLVNDELTMIESGAHREIERLGLSHEELFNALLASGLAVEKNTVQELNDQGLLPGPSARILQYELGELIDMAVMGRSIDRRRLIIREGVSRVEALVARFVPGAKPHVMRGDYADAQARRIAAAKAIEELDELCDAPGVSPELLAEAKEPFLWCQHEAQHDLDQLTAEDPDLAEIVRIVEATQLGRAASMAEVERLVELGLIPPKAAETAGTAIEEAIGDSG